MSKYESFTRPQFYVRAQVTGVLRWTCPYCANLNEHYIKPTAFKAACKKCKHHVWWGLAAHIPAGRLTSKAKDATIPVWAGDQYALDPIKFDPMPQALFDPEKPIQQRGRLHATIIHDGVYYSPDELPQSPESAKPYVSGLPISTIYHAPST